MYTDAHVHLHDLAEKVGKSLVLPDTSCVCASAWNDVEFHAHEKIAENYPGRVFLSFGIHPQNPERSFLPFLEKLVSEKRVAAIGECGLDFFTPEYRKNRDEQRYVWEAQRSIAISANIPMILHGRKAMAEFFAVSADLAKLPAVVFHGWGGSVVEARSFLDRGVNAYFSIGKVLLRGHKNARETVRVLDIDRLLSETDAPWMSLKDEEYTTLEDIAPVVQEMAAIRGLTEESLKEILSNTFFRVFTGSSGVR